MLRHPYARIPVIPIVFLVAVTVALLSWSEQHAQQQLNDALERPLVERPPREERGVIKKITGRDVHVEVCAGAAECRNLYLSDLERFKVGDKVVITWIERPNKGASSGKVFVPALYHEDWKPVPLRY